MWGGVKIDLRQAIIRSPVVDIRATALMGGIDIIVPEGIPVEVYGTVLMGGCSNRVRGELALPGAPVVRVHAAGLWGGVDVRSKPNPSAGRRTRRRRPPDSRPHTSARRPLRAAHGPRSIATWSASTGVAIARTAAAPAPPAPRPPPTPSRPRRRHGAGPRATAGGPRRRRACRSTCPRARSRCCSPTSSTPPPRRSDSATSAGRRCSSTTTGPCGRWWPGTTAPSSRAAATAT